MSRALLTGVGVMIIATAAPSSAFAAGNVSYVASYGSNSNDCSRNAPCATIGTAELQTNIGGTVELLDSGDFGHDVFLYDTTLDGNGHTLFVNPPENGYGIEAAGPRTFIRDITIRNTGTNANVTGVRGSQGRLRLEDVRIENFTASGVHFRPSVSPSSLIIRDSRIADNTGHGVYVTPATSGTGSNRATIRRSAIINNGRSGIVGETLTSFKVAVNAYDNLIAENGASGVVMSGSEARARLSENRISGNAFGLRILGGGTIYSFGDNKVFGNDVEGSPTHAVAPK